MLFERVFKIKNKKNLESFLNVQILSKYLGNLGLFFVEKFFLFFKWSCQPSTTGVNYKISEITIDKITTK